MAENGTSLHSVDRNPLYKAEAPPSFWTMNRNSCHNDTCGRVVSVDAACRVRKNSNGAVRVEDTKRADAPATMGYNQKDEEDGNVPSPRRPPYVRKRHTISSYAEK